MDNTSYFVQYKIFEHFNKLLAFTTTKHTLNTEQIRFTNEPHNKLKLATLLDIEPQKLVFPKQTHTNCVADITGIPAVKLDETDALVTNKPGVCICVQTADCVPILLFDPVNNVVSAVHAGWRGTVGKIVSIAVEKMVSNYGSSAENIVAAFGPSISPEIYEVGDEVVEAAQKFIPNTELTLRKNSSGKFHFNLWEANKQLLLGCGLKDSNIEVLGECSFLERDKYYSARRDGIETGRIVSGIMLKL